LKRVVAPTAGLLHQSAIRPEMDDLA